MGAIDVKRHWNLIPRIELAAQPTVKGRFLCLWEKY
jgi:hypothetical protein